MTARNKTSHPGIRRITNRKGTRYRLIVDLGIKPDGSRHQYCETFDRLSDAKAKQAKVIADRKAGTLVRPTKITLGQAIDTWLAGRRNLRPTTARCYQDCLRTAKERLGHIELQKLTMKHLDDLVTYLQEQGRRVGNVQRKGLGASSINKTLTLLRSVLEDAVKQGTLARNVATLVERPKQSKHEMTPGPPRRLLLSFRRWRGIGSVRPSGSRCTACDVVRCWVSVGPMSTLRRRPLRCG